MGSDTDGKLTVDLENLEDILLELEYCNTNTSYSIFCNLYESEYLLHNFSKGAMHKLLRQDI